MIPDSQIAFDFKFIVLNLQVTDLLKYLADRFLFWGGGFKYRNIPLLDHEFLLLTICNIQVQQCVPKGDGSIVQS